MVFSTYMNSLNEKYYQRPEPSNWSGRFDGDAAQHLRWHQHIKTVDLADPQDFKSAFVLLGFACDEGVRRNLGRVGAATAPMAIRKAIANAPVFRDTNLLLFDAGDVFCKDENLAAAQETLGKAVHLIRKQGGFPIVLGGGHEVTYGHYLGLRQDNPSQLGIINLDAHFDCRKPVNDIPTSGTGFYQIAEEEALKGNKLHCLPIGIQRISNTQALFDYMQAQQVDWIEAKDFHQANQEKIAKLIEDFLAGVDQLYLTIDLDVFAAPYAPGVSATAFNGLVPDNFFYAVYREILASPKLIAVDIAELNPQFDIDMRTAKLAANLIFELVATVGLLKS